MDKNRDRIAEEAAEYLARRVTGSKPLVGDGLAAWLKEDADHSRAYNKAESLWAEMDQLRHDQDLIHLKRSDLREQVGRFPWLRKMRSIAAAAAVALAVGGAFLYLQQIQPVLGSYASEPSSRRTFALDDGTRVVLNIGSEIATSFTRGQRDVVLVKGEANFHVAHDKSRPFVVRVGSTNVTALGTKFQVRRTNEDTFVDLLEGSISVASVRGRQVLVPNERATVSDSGAITVSSVDPLLVSGWTEGWLRFRSTPLSEVIEQVNRYPGQKIRLADPSLGRIELSGNFRVGDSESITSAAELILPIQVKQERGDLVVSSR